MYKIDITKKTLSKLDTTALKKENLLGRHDFQQFIYNSWESFKNDIGCPSALLLGQEIRPHDSVGDQIDLLAFDQNDSSLIVIEQYSFAKEGIELCRKIRGEGDPKRRRFGDLIKNKNGFKWISFNFREKYINVYTGCLDKTEAKESIHTQLGSHIEVSEWRDGVSFPISEEKDFKTLRKWFNL